MKKLIYIAGIIAFIVVSCDKANPVCSETIKTSSLAIDFPDSVKAGENFQLDVKYILENSCGEFDSFEVSQVDNATQIILYAKYDGCNCTLEFQERKGTFDIMVGQPGFYEYQFWVAENEWDTYILKVYQ